MSTEQISNKMANLKPQKVVIPKVWKRPHSTIYGKNVEFGSKLTSDKLGEINGRKFNSELPWTMRNSGGASSTSGSSTSQGYLSTLLNEPQSTLIGSVITSKPTDRTSSYLLPSAHLERDESDTREPTRLTANNCTNYADVLELTNPNRYSKRRAEQARDRERNLRLRTMHDNNSRKTTATPNKAKRIDFYENYLDFNNEIRRMNESSRLMNDPLMQRRSFDRHLDFNYELGLFVPVSSSSGDGRSLLSKKTLKGALESSNSNWLPEDELKQHQWRQFQTVAATNTKQAGGDDTPRPTGVNLGGHNRRQHDSFEHQSDINPAHFNPVITTTKQTPMLPKHACQLSDSPYGQSADGRKLSLGSINPHSYRPSLPHKTTTVHSSDGEEFEFQDKSSPFYTDRWAGRTIRHFDSDLYSNANLFKSMIL